MTANNDISVSIIIPVYNKVEFTEKCLEKLKANTDKSINYEIIVVDNNSHDETEKVLTSYSKRDKRVEYLKLNDNYGFGKACNQGASFARGEYLVFLNNDTEPQPGWLKSLYDRLNADTKNGIVGSKLLYPDGTIQHCGINMYKNVNPDYDYWPLHRYLGKPSDHHMVNTTEEVVAVTGACFIITKQLFREVDGFDEKYKMYFEDLDLNFKVREKELKIIYEPKSVVIHHEGKSSDNQEVIDKLNGESAKIFFKRWEKAIYYFHLRDHFKEEDENVTIIRKDIYPECLVNGTFHEKKDEAVDDFLMFFEKINSIGKAYIHFGGAGDALLLLSTFYDENPEQVIISFANSIPALRSFFSAFKKLKHVYLIPLPPNALIHDSIRKLLPKLQNIKGMGATPTKTYFEEWKDDLNIFKEYGINPSPLWVDDFKGDRNGKLRVVLAPKGSMVGMVGSKKNIISQQNWKYVVKHLLRKNLTPIIIGVPEEEEDYPIYDGCIDKRSYSFEEQIKVVASSDVFIGADSWGKTMSALTGLPTIVFKPTVGEDLKDWKDNSDYIFLDPWDDITVVENFQEFKKAFDKIHNRALNIDNGHIILEGSIAEGNSLSHVNMELAVEFQKNNYQLSLISDGKVNMHNFNTPRLRSLKSCVNQKFKDVDVHITHIWPPKQSPPKKGKWVVIQPWEFGSLPIEWVRTYREDVDEIWVPSNYVKQVCVESGIPENRVAVVPNGINPKVFYKSKSRFPLKTRKKFKFLFVGGTIYRKGIDILLKSYLHTFKKNDDVCLVIKDVGHNSFYNNSNFRTEILSIMKRDDLPEIEYIDQHLEDHELNQLYNTCDVLVHPYRGEGFGLPILEAMACGTPTIVTNGGSCVDFCNARTSLFVEASKKYFEEKKVGNLPTVNFPWVLEPSLEDLCAKMQYAFENPAQMKKLGDAAQEYTHEHWTWKNAYHKANRRIAQMIKQKGIRRFQDKDFDAEENENGASSNAMQIQSGSNVFEELLSSVQTLLDLEKYAEAEDALTKIEDVFLAMEETEDKSLLISSFYCLRGSSSLGMGEPLVAQGYFESALKIYPDSSEACVGLGEILYLNEMHTEAKTMFEWGVNNDSLNTKATSKLQKINIELGYPPEHSFLNETEKNDTKNAS